MLAQGRITAGQMLTRAFRLEGPAEATRITRQGGAVKVTFEP